MIRNDSIKTLTGISTGSSAGNTHTLKVLSHTLKEKGSVSWWCGPWISKKIRWHSDMGVGGGLNFPNLQ